jgi:hypothetical protein
MLTVNAGQSNGSTTAHKDMRVSEFWEQKYFPYCEEIVKLTGKPRKKASTMKGYKQLSFFTV